MKEYHDKDLRNIVDQASGFQIISPFSTNFGKSITKSYLKGCDKNEFCNYKKRKIHKRSND